MLHEIHQQSYILPDSIVLYCIFAIILSTFRLFKGQQYLNNMFKSKIFLDLADIFRKYINIHI